jgi:trans-aconitate methyltransferase
MEATTGLIAEQLARTVDFSETGLVIDVGGGNGALVEAILRSTPATSALVVDRRQVVANSAARFAGTDLSDRFTALSGDFFESVPAGGDAYILSRIMHDWLDDDCDRILRVCRSVIPSGVPLLILERELPDEPQLALASSFQLSLTMIQPAAHAA